MQFVLGDNIIRIIPGGGDNGSLMEEGNDFGSKHLITFLILRLIGGVHGNNGFAAFSTSGLLYGLRLAAGTGPLVVTDRLRRNTGL